MGKWMGIFGVERVGRLMNLEERKGWALQAFEVFSEPVMSKIGDGELVCPRGLGIC